MPQSLSSIRVHLIFSVAERKRCFRTEHIRTATEQYMAGIVAACDCVPVEIALAVDHAHLLLALGRQQCIADVVKAVKAGSTSWIKKQEWARFSQDFRHFHWQKGYSAFSVSPSRTKTVQTYIVSQIAHHHRVTFQDEYREFLKRHDLTFDERYVWE